MGEDDFDEKILKTAVTRRRVLTALSEAPHHRRELQDEFDISKTTCHRIVRTLDDNGLLRRTEDGYELTEKGDLVESYVNEYFEHVRAAFRLEPFVTAFGETDREFDLEAFVGARITRPAATDPTLPLSREFEIFQAADRFSVVDGNQHIPTLYLEQLYEIGTEQGMTGEHIAPKSVIEKRVTEFPELHKKVPELEATIKYRIVDEPPFGLTLYDNEHVVLRAYDDETGSIALLVDTADEDAADWAADVIDHYREQAESPASFDDLPDWIPDPDLDR